MCPYEFSNSRLVVWKRGLHYAKPLSEKPTLARDISWEAMCLFVDFQMHSE